MKKILIILFLFIFISCYKEHKELEQKIILRKGVKQKMNKNDKYITLNVFNNNYSYWNKINENLKISLLNTEKEILNKYIQYKEKNMKIYQNYKDYNNIFENFNEEEKIIQISKLIVEMYKNELFFLHNNLYATHIFLLIFSDYIENYKLEILPMERKLYKIFEENFTTDELEIILKTLTYNSEFENYDVEKIYNLKKVDEILNKLKKIEGLSEEQWIERESKSYIPLIENEIDNLFELIYLLKDNRIIIVDENKEITKEVKIKDYKNTDVAMYKGILYIYDDEKIYEYSLKNLDDVNIIDVKELVF